MQKRSVNGTTKRRGIKVEKKEIMLGQTKYMILQYFRTSEDQFVTCQKVADKLMLDRKTIAGHIRDMVAMGILSENYPVERVNHVREIKVTQEWLH